jgi:DNA-binding LacI/PurR family transcriptional regulator
VLRAASDLGYRPDRTASLLARRRSQLLGVTMTVSNPFHADLLEDLQAAADERGYDIVVSPLTRTRDERRAVESLLDFRCEALLLLGPVMSNAELAELAAEHHVVAIGRPVDVPGVDVVRAADDLGVAMVVEHLADLGHRSIAFVDGPRGSIAAVRRQGFRAAVRRLRLDSSRVVAGGATEESGQAAVNALVDAGVMDGHSRVTGLVCFNDRAALGALDALRRNGIHVPEDVSLVGYDDSPVARLATIDLTTVSQAPEPMAVAAVEAATQRLDEGRAQAVDIVLEPHLVLRGTTARPSEPAPV